MGSGLRMNAQRLDCVVDNTEVVGQLDRAAGEIPGENPTHEGATVPLLEARRLDRVTEAFLRRLLPSSHLGDATVRPAFVFHNSLLAKTVNGRFEVACVTGVDETRDRRRQRNRHLAPLW